MQLDECTRKWPGARAPRTAPDAADLLSAERDDRTSPGSLDGLEARDDPERSVEAAALRHGVEMRADPHVLALRGVPEEVPARVDFDVEPGLSHPLGRELVRLVLAGSRMRSVRARPAADGVQLVEPLEHPHRVAVCRRSLSDPSTHQPTSEMTAATTNANDHDPDDTVAAKKTGPATPSAARTVCWMPIVAPLRSAPASSAAAVNESPFHAIVSPPARTRTGTRSQVGPPARTAVKVITPTIPRPDESQRHDACPDSVGPAAASDPERATQHLRPGEHQRCRPSRQPVLVDEEENAEPQHRDLGVQEEAAAERQPPEPAVRDRRPAIEDASIPSGASRPRRTRAPTSAPIALKAARKRNAASVPAASAIEGSDNAPMKPAEWDCGLADAECEAALLCTEPVHDGASARRVDGRTGGADEPQCDDDFAVARRERRPHEKESGPEQARGEHEALAVPVRGEAPREERQRRSNPGSGKHDADLAQREVELLA